MAGGMRCAWEANGQRRPGGTGWNPGTWPNALLRASAAGLVPMLLPLVVHRSRGAAYVGWVVAAYNLAGLTAPLWRILADRYRLHRCLVVGGDIIAAVG
jgi:hypothetical protein